MRMLLIVIIALIVFANDAQAQSACDLHPNYNEAIQDDHVFMQIVFTIINPDTFDDEFFRVTVGSIATDGAYPINVIFSVNKFQDGVLHEYDYPHAAAPKFDYSTLELENFYPEMVRALCTVDALGGFATPNRVVPTQTPTK